MDTSNDVQWMQQALDLADQAENHGEVPIGAILVNNNVCIGQGWNQPISSHDPSAHAEIIALRQAGAHISNYRFPDATLYVTLEPCLMCIGALLHARIKRVVFGAQDGKIGTLSHYAPLLNTAILNHQIIWQGGCLADACALKLRDFFKLRR